MCGFERLYYCCLCNLPIENFLGFLLTECSKILFKRNFKFLKERKISPCIKLYQQNCSLIWKLTSKIRHYFPVWSLPQSYPYFTFFFFLLLEIYHFRSLEQLPYRLNYDNPSPHFCHSTWMFLLLSI